MIFPYPIVGILFLRFCLSASSAEGLRIYERLGFQHVGSCLCFERSPQ